MHNVENRPQVLWSVFLILYMEFIFRRNTSYCSLAVHKVLSSLTLLVLRRNLNSSWVVKLFSQSSINRVK